MRRVTAVALAGLSILALCALVGRASARPAAHRSAPHRSARAACGTTFAFTTKRAITARRRHGRGSEKLGEAYVFLRTHKPTKSDPYTTYQFCYVIDLTRTGEGVHPVLQSNEYGKDRSDPLEQSSHEIGGSRTVEGTSERPDARSLSLKIEWYTGRGPVRTGSTTLSAHV